MSRTLPPLPVQASQPSWTSEPRDGAPVEWSVDPDQGRIQGPLDLECLRGQRMSLILTEGQQALLVREGKLQAVYLDGAHHLEIGTGDRQIDPACELIFLALGGALRLGWTSNRPLRWGADEGQTLLGNCNLHIEWPTRFYDTFLHGRRDLGAGFTESLIEQMVRGLFEAMLAPDPESGQAPDASQVQTRLTRLQPDDLNDDLHPCGLNCTHLAVYTTQPPSEEAVPAAATPTAVLV